MPLFSFIIEELCKQIMRFNSIFKLCLIVKKIHNDTSYYLLTNNFKMLYYMDT